ncbi:MAG: Outer membrane protein assembly factor BamA [Gammaproteobacteria bacterium]|nr:Outer membrane protein assembly factor BamA [Gammaproteobacteria bacterium]
MKKILAGLILLFGFSFSVHAIEPFVVEDIEVEGLQHVSAGTVFNYLPIKVGDEVDDEFAREAIKVLFGTGFFQDVVLSKDGSTLVVSVKESPSIAGIELVGLDELDEDTTREQLNNLGLGKGRVFNPSVLDKVIQELKSQYFSIGKYAAEIESEVTPSNNNRVDVKIEVREGKTAKIERINLVGNEEFSEKELKDEFELSTKRRLFLFSPNDEYSRQQLQADLEALRSFYQDKGYLNFEIESTQVTISADKKDIFVTVNVHEGERYTVSDFAVKGRFTVPEEELVKLVTIKPEEVFSQRDVSESREAIVNRLGDDGYAFANVNSIPRINEEDNTVSLDLVIDPGRRVYVRRIDITGNRVTHDEVIRREMRQLEGAWYSTQEVQRSKTRLDRTGFFSRVAIDTESVPGSPDQVDVNVKVEERSTGSVLIGVGFSDADGILLQGQLSQENLFGTGRELSLVADNSSVTQRLQLRYLNPYWTINGISRGFTLFQREIDAEEADTAAYVMDTLGGGMNFGFPLSEFTNIGVGVQVEKVELESTLDTPPEIADFIEESAENDILKVTGNFSHDTRDSRLFPSEGSLRRLTWEVSTPPSDLEYYKLTARNDTYFPFAEFLILKASGEVGYGDSYGGEGELPFFENFFAGGASTVRGYDARSLGPRDSGDTPETLGGDRRILGNIEFMIPLPGDAGEDKRFSFFIDGGQVYGPDEDLDLGDIRYSAGLAFSWFSPLGPLALSVAKPLNDKDGDDIQRVQFTLGRFFQ